MTKIIMLSGLPASGKSTKAKEIIEKGGNWIRVNKDLLRTMLHFDKFNFHNENITVDIEKIIAINALSNGLNVVVDDTNLNKKNRESWSQLAKAAKAEFSTEHFDTDMYECLKRDAAREKPVGAHVIKHMAMQYGLGPVPQKGWVICDIDGTLANLEHRKHFVTHPADCGLCSLDPAGKCAFKKDWKSFFGAMEEDTLIQDTAKIVAELAEEGHTIIFVSARPETYRKQTETWLMRNGMLNFGFSLLMRYANDSRPDTEVKKQILDTYFKDKSKIYKVIDDRPAVIRMWRENGLDVIDVGLGIEF